MKLSVLVLWGLNRFSVHGRLPRRRDLSPSFASELALVFSHLATRNRELGTRKKVSVPVFLRNRKLGTKKGVCPGFFSRKSEIPGVDETDRRILDLLRSVHKSSELSEALGVSIPTVVKRLNRLASAGVVVKKGRGKNTYYILPS